MIFGALVMLLMILVFSRDSSSDAHEVAPVTEHSGGVLQPPTSHSAVDITPPTDEAVFISKLESYRAQYQGSPNEFVKSQLRHQRREELRQIVASGSVSGWVGSISKMETTHEGLGILRLRLTGRGSITLGTWNNGLSDIGSNTLIPQDSELYSKVSHLAVGQDVVFSGNFELGDTDYLRESSLTEEGSMTEPDFIFRFSDLKTISEAQSNRPAANTNSMYAAPESSAITSQPADTDVRNDCIRRLIAVGENVMAAAQYCDCETAKVKAGVDASEAAKACTGH